ncbi:hypothetical protein QRX50_28560 [Amycolatopsis carbonis]|uniref:Uncharacterized protein n=1 Tax=Amycolatopsis carbonis TaxID=715471 RepID=A0A9Y2MRH1_9PSEU|nr:hypothetical protein [Amycolatopsis sp. 2-15]WIX75461.1 hypothetical protein QRX50_28560 [Amycolatopsis sp. 2-15]
MFRLLPSLVHVALDASGIAVAEILGLGADGAVRHTRVTVSDPFGQAHVTAVGVLIGTERVLGLDGGAPLAAGLHVPERAVNAERAVSRLRDFGVSVAPSLAREGADVRTRKSRFVSRKPELSCRRDRRAVENHEGVGR